MCSGSEAGSYLRLLDFVSHSTLCLRVIKKKRKTALGRPCRQVPTLTFLFIQLKPLKK